MNNPIKANQLILTAIDNNDGIWYECLVPYLATLRQTDFAGDVGIINYGLSPHKIAILEQENCKIFQPAGLFPELLLDRFASVAKIAAQEDYEQLAILDTDIWFPTSHFSLFSKVQDREKLYCTFDVWLCTFLYDCIDPAMAPELENKINSLLQKNGHIWQAAVCVADKQGWANYLAYLEQRLTPPHHFLFRYGIDATLMNLYAAETDNVVNLPKKYNALPPWGIGYVWDYTGDIAYLLEGELVECLHVTRNHRNDGLLAYPKLHPKKYFDAAKRFRLSTETLWNITKESIIAPYAELYPENIQTLRLEFAKANKLSTSFKAKEVGYQHHSIILTVGGESVICLRNPHSEQVTLYFRVETAMGERVNNQFYFYQGNSENRLELNKDYVARLQPNETLELRTRDIEVERYISWVLYSLRLID